MEVIAKENIEECVCPYCRKTLLLVREDSQTIQQRIVGSPQIAVRTRINNKNKRWTAEEDNALIQMKANGCSWGEIKSALKRSKNSCSTRFYIALNQGKGKAQRIQSQNQPVNARANKSKGWTQQDDQNLIDMYNRKLKAKEIALRLMRTVGSIYERINKLRTDGKLGYKNKMTSFFGFRKSC